MVPVISFLWHKNADIEEWRIFDLIGIQYEKVALKAVFASEKQEETCCFALP